MRRLCAAGIARSGSGQPGERQNIGQLHGQKFRGAARGRITGGVYKQCRRRAEHHHDRRESRPGHTEPAMQVRPPVADQRDLHAEQHQPADEGDGMTVDDQSSPCFLTWLKLSLPKPDSTPSQTRPVNVRKAFQSARAGAGKLPQVIVVIGVPPCTTRRSPRWPRPSRRASASSGRSAGHCNHPACRLTHFRGMASDPAQTLASAKVTRIVPNRLA